MLRFADAEAIADHFLGDVLLRIGTGDAENGASVAEAKQTGADVTLDVGMELENAEEVRDGGAIFADFYRGFFLGEIEIFDQLAVAERFFNRVEILALEILDEGEFENFAVVSFADEDGKFGEAGELGGAPATFAGDEFIRPVARADDERLKDSLLFDGVGEFLDRILGEIFAGLKWARDDAGDGNALHLLAGRFCRGGSRNCGGRGRSGRRRCRSFTDGAAHECAQAATQSWFGHGWRVADGMGVVNFRDEARWRRAEIDLRRMQIVQIDSEGRSCGVGDWA